jgi:hypothetical protein
MLQYTHFSIFFLSLWAMPIMAQQTGNYTSEMVEARTRSKDASGSPQLSDWKRFETRIIDNIKDFKPLTRPVFSKYGSSKEQKFVSSGFFRVEKIGNRWWIIDPEGYAGINVSVNSVNQGASERNKQAFKQQFGNAEQWMKTVNQQLRELGFNGTGSWSETDAIRKANLNSSQPLVYTVNLNLMSGYGKKRGGTHSVPGHTGYLGGAIFVFDPEFEKYCEEQAVRLAQYKNDPNLFGYFSDNEMPLNLKNLESYLSIGNEHDYGYQAARKWLADQGITKEQITDSHRAAFLAFVGEKYFSIVSKAIKKHDPNHLYLGSRFYSSEKNVPEFMKTVGKYIDILSINYYGVWTPTKEFMAKWANWSGRPFMITEFYTKGMDSGLPNISGAGWQVRTQEDRGKAYQNYCLALLESKNCVGWHWFKYQDNDPTDKNSEASNTDANKGIVDNDYKIYKPLADKMRQLNINRYQLIKYFDTLHNK